MATPSNCPKCGVDFKGEPIPEHLRDAYGATHYGRVILVKPMDYWKCPDCGLEWGSLYGADR